MDTQSRADGLPLWLLPNLLSLDAPLVAVVWQDFLSRDTGLPLRPTARIVLFLTVWLIYITDRLLDVRKGRMCPSTMRHRFYRDHRRGAIGALIMIAVLDAYQIVVNVRPVVLRSGVIASLGVLGYLAILHLPTRAVRLPKELLVALLFTGGTFVVAWTDSPAPMMQLGWRAVTFFLLCLANLVLIERWEWRELRGGLVGDSPWITAALRRGFPLWVSLLAGVCVIQSSVLRRGTLSGEYGTAGSGWIRAVAIGALANIALMLVGARLRLPVRRVLVDLVLLSPLLIRR